MNSQYHPDQTLNNLISQVIERLGALDMQGVVIERTTSQQQEPEVEQEEQQPTLNRGDQLYDDLSDALQEAVDNGNLDAVVAIGSLMSSMLVSGITTLERE